MKDVKMPKASMRGLVFQLLKANSFTDGSREGLLVLL